MLEGSCDWNEEERGKEEEKFMSYVAVYLLANHILSLPLPAMSACMRTLKIEGWEAQFCLGKSMGGKGLSGEELQ